MGKSAKIRHRRRRRQERRWTPVSSAELARVLNEIIFDDQYEQDSPYAKWLVASVWKTPDCPVI